MQALIVTALAALALSCLAGAAAGSTSSEPRCFGAAARDPRHPCHNPKLRFAALPGADLALLTPNYPCTPRETIGNAADRADGALTICDFGVPQNRAARTVALIGDSHAMAWRAAVASAITRLGWHGIDMTRSHCAFSAAAKALDQTEVTGCFLFNQRVVTWLREHPEVTAAFTAHQTGGTPVIARPGVSEFQTEVAGFQNAWQALPANIQNVFVIRDNPVVHGAGVTARCAHRARAAGTTPGRLCALPRSQALLRDPFSTAVARLDSPRYRLLDLTRYMCAPHVCLSVVGGVIVTKDGAHLTREFSDSLGPYLARRVRASIGGPDALSATSFIDAPIAHDASCSAGVGPAAWASSAVLLETEFSVASGWCSWAVGA